MSNSLVEPQLQVQPEVCWVLDDSLESRDGTWRDFRTAAADGFAREASAPQHVWQDPLQIVFGRDGVLGGLGSAREAAPLVWRLATVAWREIRSALQLIVGSRDRIDFGLGGKSRRGTRLAR